MVHCRVVSGRLRHLKQSAMNRTLVGAANNSVLEDVLNEKGLLSGRALQIFRKWANWSGQETDPLLLPVFLERCFGLDPWPLWNSFRYLQRFFLRDQRSRLETHKRSTFRLLRQSPHWQWSGAEKGQDAEKLFSCSGSKTSVHRRFHCGWGRSEWSKLAPVDEGHISRAGVAIGMELWASGETSVPVRSYWLGH